MTCSFCRSQDQSCGPCTTPEIALPLRGQAFDPDKHAPGPPTREFTLQAGDLLYCPRGLFHSARSTDEASLHITLGLIGKTWADVMIEAVSAACLASPAFRANLPVGFANARFRRNPGLTSRSARSSTCLPARPSWRPSSSDMTEDFVTSRRPALHGCLQEGARNPNLRSRARLHHGLTSSILLREEARRARIAVWSDARSRFPHLRETP